MTDMIDLEYRTAIDGLTDAIHVVDRDLRITLFNHAFEEWNVKLGLKRQAVGRRLQDVFPFLKPDVLDEYRQVFQAGRILATEEATRVGKQVFYTETRKIPVLDNGQVVRVITAVRDITRRKQAEAEHAAMADKLRRMRNLDSLSVLAGGIAHDFNNLLMVILCNAELVTDDLAAVSPTRQNVLEITSAARRAADLCRQLLAFSGKGHLYALPISLTELAHDLAAPIAKSVRRNVRVAFSLADPLPAIQADALELRQAVLNLVANADEAIGAETGTITLATGAVLCDRECLADFHAGVDLPEGRYVFLDVTDTGCGMDAQTLQKIFDPFFTTKFVGRGLGLSAVIGIMRGHRGGIRVESRAGSGTSVRLLFPVLAEPKQPLKKEGLPVPAEASGGTILLVDDDPTVLLVGRRMIEKGGFRVVTASSGDEAIARFRELASALDGVVLDLSMPQMGGEEAFRAIQAIRPDVPVLISSGYDEAEVADRFRGQKIAGFLQKPYESRQIVDKLRAVLAGRPG